MFNNRWYIYGVTEDGTSEMITSELSDKSAIDFAKRHQDVFKDRYVSYYVETMSGERKGV